MRGVTMRGDERLEMFEREDVCLLCGLQSRLCLCEPREKAVHLVYVINATTVSRVVCGFRGAPYTTTLIEEVTCDGCKRGHDVRR